RGARNASTCWPICVFTVVICCSIPCAAVFSVVVTPEICWVKDCACVCARLLICVLAAVILPVIVCAVVVTCACAASIWALRLGTSASTAFFASAFASWLAFTAVVLRLVTCCAICVTIVLICCFTVWACVMSGGTTASICFE